MTNLLHLAWNTFLFVFAIGFIGWLFIRAFKRSHDRIALIIRWICTLVIGWFQFTVALPAFAKGGFDAIFGLILTMVFGIVINILWRHSIIEMIAKPLTSVFDGGNEEVEPKPLYSIAQAKRTKNRPLEAIAETRKQLAKFPNDFEGVSLLANIQAEDMADLQGAEITLNKFCASPKAPDRQVVAALTQLADWHLKKAVDIDAARAALQRIVARFPDTEVSLRAEQRLAHLGETETILLGQHDRQAMALPEGVHNVGLLDSTTFLQPKEIEPGKLAAVYVKQLEDHPHDFQVREKLAVIYAQDFKRLDLATMELEQLINEKRHSSKQIAGWLNQLANFQIELGADVATVTATLERIVEEFPDSPLAELAQRRLARVGSEIKGKEKTPGVKLGVYEQNIGLKYGSPRKQ